MVLLNCEVVFLNDFLFYEKEINNSNFIINREDYKIFKNLKNYIRKEFRFIWIDEKYFQNKFINGVYNKIPNSLWKECSSLGLIIKRFDFYHKYSDLGSDNDITIIFGDSKYSKFRGKKTLSVKHDPAGRCDNEKPGKYYDIEENVFEYFYEKKKYVLINFDEIAYITDIRYCGVDDMKILLNHKKIFVPSSYMDNTFILTTDYEL